MGFRNEEEARFHRIQALETELEERDRKIAALEEMLEGKRKPKKEPKAKEGDDATNAPAAKVSKVAGVPEGSVGRCRFTGPICGAWGSGFSLSPG